MNQFAFISILLLTLAACGGGGGGGSVSNITPVTNGVNNEPAIFTYSDQIENSSRAYSMVLNEDTSCLLIKYFAHSQSMTNYRQNSITVRLLDSNNVEIAKSLDSFSSESTSGTPIPGLWHSVRFRALNLKAKSAVILEITVSAGDFRNYVDSIEVYKIGSCADYAKIQYAPGVLIQNNLWNKQSVESAFGCIDETGWSWDVVNSNPAVTASFQGAIFGWKPFELASTNSVLPKNLAAISSAKTTFDVSTSASVNSIMNTAIEWWITSDATPSSHNIVAEIMVWLDTTSMTPGGTFLKTVTIGGADYRLYYAPTWTHGGSYFVFQQTSPVSTGAVDILAFTKLLQSEGLLSSAGFLASVEIGNEVVSGKGNTKLNTFSVAIE